MVAIRISSTVTREEYRRYEAQWRASKNASFELCLDLHSPEQANTILDIAEANLPSEFSFVVIETLAELEWMPVDILKRIVRFEDTACREAVCLRHDLDDELKSICGSFSRVHEDNSGLSIKRP